MSFDAGGKQPRVPFKVSRRHFVQGLAAGGAIAGFGLWPRPSWAVKSAGIPNALSGTEFDLSIGEAPANFTGLTRPAIMVNGSIPAPLLRWREGTKVNLRVSNTLPPKIRSALAAKISSTIQNTTVDMARLVTRVSVSERAAERGIRRATSQSMLSSARRTRVRNRCASSQPIKSTAAAVSSTGR